MSLSRCLRCESLYYNDRVEPSCRYHVGQFRAWWSCCKEPLYSARGCRSGMHVEDQSYTQLLDSYCPPAIETVPIVETPRCVIEGPNGEICFAAEIIVTQPEPAPVQEVATQPPEQGPREPPVESSTAAGGSGTRTVAVPYFVSAHDTFSSICLKHRMTADEVLRLNGLSHRRARVGDVLLVWGERSDNQENEDWHRSMVRQFRRRSGCSAGEALYYLEQHEYRIGDALRERDHDAQWQSERAELIQLLAQEEETARQAKEEQAAAGQAAAGEEEAEDYSSRPFLADPSHVNVLRGAHRGQAQSADGSLMQGLANCVGHAGVAGCLAPATNAPEATSATPA